MRTDRSAAASCSTTNRSKTTNNPRRLAGVDGRSADGRRRRDLIDSFVAALGGADRVSAPTMTDVSRAADLTIIAERARADALRGCPVDLTALTRIEGAADRAVRRLGIKPGAEAPKPTIADYVARKAAEKAAGSQSGEAA